MTLTTPPEIKPCIKATDDVLTVGSYVEVIEDYSKGFNRPSGCGYVLRVTDKVIDVKYTAAHDSGRRHTNIPLTKAIPAILHQGSVVEEVVEAVEEVVEEVVEVVEGDSGRIIIC